MKAIVQDVYGSAGVLKLRDIDRPSIGDGEVLVQVRAAGVDPGVWHLMTGEPYLVRAMGFGLSKPKVGVRGRDVAGVVDAVGARVTRFRRGDEVYGTCESGSFAEYAAAPEEHLASKPASVSFEQAAAVPISGVTALQAVRDCGRVQPGQQVMVIGAAGGVGSFAVQIAKAFGARVTGVCSTPKARLVRSLGADDVIDYAHDEIDCHGARYDVVIDTAGNRRLPLLRRAMTPHGTLVLVGGEHGGGRLLGGFDRQFRAPLVSMFAGQRLRGLVAKERAEDLEALTRRPTPSRPSSTAPTPSPTRPMQSVTSPRVTPRERSSSPYESSPAQDHVTRPSPPAKVAPGTWRRQRHATASTQLPRPRREPHSSKMSYAGTTERLPVVRLRAAQVPAFSARRPVADARGADASAHPQPTLIAERSRPAGHSRARSRRYGRRYLMLSRPWV